MAVAVFALPVVFAALGFAAVDLAVLVLAAVGFAVVAFLTDFATAFAADFTFPAALAGAVLALDLVALADFLSPKMRSQPSPNWGVVPVRTIGPLIVSQVFRLTIRQSWLNQSLRIGWSKKRLDVVIESSYPASLHVPTRLAPGYRAASLVTGDGAATPIVARSLRPVKIRRPGSRGKTHSVPIESSIRVASFSSNDVDGCCSIKNAVPFLPGNEPLTCFHSEPS